MSMRWLVGLAAILIFFFGCSSDSDGNGGGGGTGDAQKYLIEAYIGSAEWGINSLAVYVGRLNSTDPSAKEAQITFNGTQIPLRSLVSTDDDAVYVSTNCGWSPSTNYTLNISLAGKTATCSFTSPAAYDVNITSPADFSTFVPGQPLNVVWQYSGGNPEWVEFSVEGDTILLLCDTLNGSTTNYNFPGSVTSGWASYSSIDITVNLGEYFWPITGTLASVGSFVSAILPASDVELYPEGGDTTDTTHHDTVWTVSVSLGDYFLYADGSNHTTVTARVFDQSLRPCPDGTPVTFSSQPVGRVTISPTVVNTIGGIASATVTAGTTPGDVNIIATCLGSSGYESLSLQQVVNITISVGQGPYPQISWTPADQPMYGIAIRKTGIGIGNMRWIIAGPLHSPVTYGTTPEGVTQIYPAGGARPDSFAIGSSYIIGVVYSTGDTAFYTHTRTSNE